jgi:hypothetical protein
MYQLKNKTGCKTYVRKNIFKFPQFNYWTIGTNINVNRPKRGPVETRKIRFTKDSIITITILNIIHPPVFSFKHEISEDWILPTFSGGTYSVGLNTKS